MLLTYRKHNAPVVSCRVQIELICTNIKVYIIRRVHCVREQQDLLRRLSRFVLCVYFVGKTVFRSLSIIFRVRPFFEEWQQLTGKDGSVQLSSVFGN